MRSFIVLIGSLAGFALIVAIAFICFFAHNLSDNLKVTTNAPGDAPTIPAPSSQTTTP